MLFKFILDRYNSKCKMVCIMTFIIIYLISMNYRQSKNIDNKIPLLSKFYQKDIDFCGVAIFLAIEIFLSDLR